MSEPEHSVRTMAGLLRSWPDWLLVVCFVILGVAFGLAGKLDDWLRVLLAITFLAIAVTLIARWRLAHPAGEAHTDPPLPDPSDVGPQPPED